MLEIDPTKRLPPLNQPWRNLITIGRAYELLRQDAFEHLARAQGEIGFNYIRFHGLFHDDMDVVRRQKDGSLRYQWGHVNKVIEGLLSLGIRPFVELGPMPAALASGKTTIFHWKMNVTPPVDYSEWSDLVGSFTRHCVERFGLEEVRSWYFEVWNEPNLAGFWDAEKPMEEYWKLYDHAVRAVKAVDEQLRVGGPATANSAWVPEFLEHCHSEQVPVDFVSTHQYPQDEYVIYSKREGSPHEPGRFFVDQIKRVRREIEESPLPGVELHYTEWNPQHHMGGEKPTWSENVCCDDLFGGSFLMPTCLELDETVDSLGFWVVTDIFEEPGIPQAPFTCTYGLITPDGIAKPTYHAFRLMARLGNRERVEVRGMENEPRFSGICAVEEAGSLRAMLYNHPPPELRDEWKPWSARLAIRKDYGEDLQALVFKVRKGAGSARETWEAMGRPHNPTVAQDELLRAHATPEASLVPIRKGASGWELELTLEPHEFALIEVFEKREPIFGKGSGRDYTKLDEQLTLT